MLARQPRRNHYNDIDVVRDGCDNQLIKVQCGRNHHNDMDVIRGSTARLRPQSRLGRNHHNDVDVIRVGCNTSDWSPHSAYCSDYVGCIGFHHHCF